MKIALITGSSGLIGSQACLFFAEKGFHIIGIDNDMRATFFGEDASTKWQEKRLSEEIKDYSHYDIDIRDLEALKILFEQFNKDIEIIIHAAAQPSHDWAAQEPLTDFTVNANGTLNLLELTRQLCPEAVFIFASTNKVYGDRPNSLPLLEGETRWDLPQNHALYDGIAENFSVDQSTHSLFGSSKLAADILVQEYGRYFGLKTAALRGGCLTGPNHSGTELHGFLAYLMKCAATAQEYTIFGYNGKQVRDNIHSYDFVNAMYHFYQNPKIGEVYNIGGGRERSCSIIEAIAKCEQVTGQKIRFKYSDENRVGDHIWYISNLSKFQSDYPSWRQQFTLEETLQQIYEQNKKRWSNINAS